MPYLLKDDLKKLSGAKQRRRIIPWLKEIGVPFLNDADGWPLVDESVLKTKLGASVRKEPRINFA